MSRTTLHPLNAYLARLVALSLLTALPGAAAVAETGTAASESSVVAVAAPAPPQADAPEDANGESEDAAAPVEEEGSAGLASDMENVKRALLDLKRDLTILEEDLLFPASSQVSVFLAMDVGEFFQLDSVTLKINGREVTHHLYSESQVDALYRGGIQKLFIGNVKQGKNRVTAFFTGRGPAERDYKRAATVEFEKTFEPAFVELTITDSTTKYQPEFQAAVTN